VPKYNIPQPDAIRLRHMLDAAREVAPALARH